MASFIKSKGGAGAYTPLVALCLCAIVLSIILYTYATKVEEAFATAQSIVEDGVSSTNTCMASVRPSSQRSLPISLGEAPDGVERHALVATGAKTTTTGSRRWTRCHDPVYPAPPVPFM